MLGFINLSGPHILIILVVMLLLFGNRLPEVARSIGRAFNEFKRGLRDVQDDVNTDMPDQPTPPRQIKPPAENAAGGSVSRESSRTHENAD